MTSPIFPAPEEPLVVILGSTGTGKSELAVEIATRFRGEVINADAMQLYRGLPIITNKITPAEQRGVPHHLLDRIPLSAVPWDVTEFKRHALETIREIRARGNLPILVGGTHYYVEPLLFADAILDDVQQDEARSFPILEASTADMLAELRRVDPEMADKWHPNDRRKIQRSLEIYLHTGKTASALYAEQQERKAAATAAAGDKEEESSWENLLLWVYSERDVLCERLDRRVDKMLAGGLTSEVQELQRFHAASAAAGTALDTTKGIWQSIGYKQLAPSVAAASRGAPPAEVARLQAAGLEDMKTATRRYANYQNKWIRGKQIPRLRQRGARALGSLYVLDSTDAARYAETVVAPGADLVARFLGGEARPHPRDVSELARQVLEAATETASATPQTPLRQTCEECGTTVVTREAWDRHVKSAGHRRVLRKKKRLALVPVEQGPEPVEASENGDGDSDPGISSLLGEQ
ncbi:tRNA isopentenyltransferase [Cordyceps fumosorosea ARSEF 2679]|uniref:tRNA dimethylallyltransferase n=1 Tax=Cordyceps fumosorosea (strain ARSEF 2679) TaxID=1081104 RepID=A0A162IGL7_CORFA|nr:tRNA isopentenyltransferase [Cordyceps fumosorosea ARSEF 2679]OAA56875.1 tRNA isopentenyltransferase [Cordyceps fumosorosea ARSEF 2679]